MARQYTKKSPYWEQRSTKNITPISTPTVQGETETYAAFDGREHYTEGSCNSGNPNGYQSTSTGIAISNGNFPYLNGGLMPFEDVNGYYSIGSSIELVTKAYFNVAIVRNVINLMVDFSVSKIHLKGGTKPARDFIKAWFKSTGMRSFVRRYFLEYYRSGNTFIYKYNGRLSTEHYNKLKTAGVVELESKAALEPKLPIRYVILNPSQVFLQKGAMANNGYVRAMSTFELARLKNAQTEEDKQVFRDLPKAIQESIKKGAAFRYVYIPLEQDRLFYTFYRKQDYEPLAVPMIFAVLPDIEWKLTLKAMDMSLTKTMDQIFLLVTAGRAADQYNPSSSIKGLDLLRKIFAEQAIGRVLVADYTAKAEWVMPDFKGLLGKEKYERVNEDIKEGLQFVFFGDEKFANAQTKARILIESLKEGRAAFIEDFLQAEINKVCETMGFRGSPTAEFEEIRMQDEALMARLYTQMAQVGLLTPDELNKALETGMLPTKEQSIQDQEEYKEMRKDGLYVPLMGGSDQGAQDGGNGRPNGTGGTPATRNVKTPIGQSKASSIVNEKKLSYNFGVSKLANSIVKATEFRDYVEAALSKKFKIKDMDDAQKDFARILASNMIVNEGAIALESNKDNKGKWKEMVASYIESPKGVSKEKQAIVDDITMTFDTDPWIATILSQSLVERPTE
jgi:hypothetical protein